MFKDDINIIDDWQQKKEFILIHMDLLQKGLNEINMFLGVDQKKQAFCFVDRADHTKGFYVKFAELTGQEEEIN